MNYSQDEFIALMDVIEEAGGMHLDMDCTPERFRLKTSPDGPERIRETQACGNPSLFDIPFPLPDGSDLVNTGTVRVCAVCDNVGLWPRFTESGSE